MGERKNCPGNDGGARAPVAVYPPPWPMPLLTCPKAMNESSLQRGREILQEMTGGRGEAVEARWRELIPTWPT